MSFYITLPSNASLDKFPKNTQSSFTTELQNAIVLNQSYEVALTELNNHSKISIDLGQLIIDDFLSNYYDFQFPLLNKITTCFLVWENQIKSNMWPAIHRYLPYLGNLAWKDVNRLALCD